MLSRLTISNFVLIDYLSVEFSSGYTSVTGETGAGKSLFVGALSLLLGKRAESSMIKQGATKCIIEGEFATIPQQAEQWLQENDLLFEGEEYCLLRRELATSGRGRCFINDTPVSLTQLAELGAMLLDIHSQHQNLSLTGSSFQMRMVDKMLPSLAPFEAYTNAYAEYRGAEKALAQLTEEIRRGKEEYDYNLFKYNELNEAQLKENEETELAEQEEQLSHADEIKAGLFETLSLLEGEGEGALSLLLQAERALQSVATKVSTLEEYAERLHSCRIELNDVRTDLGNLSESVESNPLLLEQVTDRLDLLNTLFQKYRVPSSQELITLRDQLKALLQQHEDQDMLLQEAEQRLTEARQSMDQAAAVLTEMRRTVAQKIAERLTEDLHQLEMPHAYIEVALTPTDSPTPMGYDQVILLFGANGAKDIRPIGEVASGGEIARVMLAVKAMLAERDQLPTLLFDEIDTGVSGRVADKMGKILQSMGHYLQVIAITHLPQMAARSGAQMCIAKRYDEQQMAHTELTLLDAQQREDEIARLISGDTITEAARAAARELLNND